jgi:hypothetical protein
MLRHPELRRGLAWGRPGKGHPEGSVGAYVDHLLETVDAWSERGERSEEPRFIALVHDSLKYRVQHWRPRTGENHHAMRARRLAELYTDDERLLGAIEQHDRPYGLWRKLKRTGRRNDDAFERMLGRIPDVDLFVRFGELDGSTEGKRPEPLDWLKDALRRRGRAARAAG